MLQRKLIFADRMASLSTLAAGVAHEINNPLAYIIANTTMIIRGLRDPEKEVSEQTLEEFREMALDAQEGAERIRRLVGGLEAFSRAEKQELTVVDLVPVLDRAIAMTLEDIQPHARVIRDYGTVPPVEADEARLGQVFTNLLENAAHAVGKADTTANEIRINASTDAEGRAVIEIADTGVGIADSVMSRVFDPFFTTKPIDVGTGLGLSVCHSLVTGLGGTIGVESQERLGSTFRVVLPAIAPS